MSTFIRICAAAGAVLFACIAGLTCVKVAAHVHQNVTAGDPTMLFGTYRIDGALGYLVPGAIGVVAFLCLALAALLVRPKEEPDA